MFCNRAASCISWIANSVEIPQVNPPGVPPARMRNEVARKERNRGESLSGQGADISVGQSNFSIDAKQQGDQVICKCTFWSC